MAPLIHNDFDLSSSHHDVDIIYGGDKMYATAPLHEGPISAASTPPSPPAPIAEKKKKRGRRVTFDKIVFCNPVIGLQHYTDSERAACWYSPENMAAMKQNVRAEARLVDRGLLREDTLNYTTTIRGLEGKTRDGQRERREKRLEAYAAVFSEIEFQSEEDFQDDELIADAYFAYSDACALAAATVGASDAIAARIIYREDAAAARMEKLLLQQQQRRLGRQQRNQKRATPESAGKTTKSSFFRRSC